MDKLTITNNGEAIYYDGRLIDDNTRFPYYWQGLAYWKEKIAEGWTDEIFTRRHNLICKLIKERNG